MDALAKLRAADAPEQRLEALEEIKNVLAATSETQANNKSQHEILPSLFDLLDSTPIAYQGDSMDQQIRLAAVEALHLLRFDEDFKPMVHQLMTRILSLLKDDNEDIACVCLKIFIDLHKAYKTFIESFVQPFLDIVLKIYQGMPDAVKAAFEEDEVSKPIGIAPESTKTEHSPSAPLSPLVYSENVSASVKSLVKSSSSFRVLTECPIIIVLLFSTYRQIVQANLVLFTPAIIDMLSLSSPDSIAASVNEASSHHASPTRRQTFADFLLAQIKTLSFLAYILRGFTTYMKKYASVIPQFVIRLLQDCPADMSAARKELLVAVRHILSTDFRNAFIDKIELLLDESVLVGSGVTARETLRPLAYSMLADLIHHVRADLNNQQIRKTITVYSANLLDSSLSSSIQTMSAKLLLNMIDRIMKLSDLVEARSILMLILSCFTNKIAALNTSFDQQNACSQERNMNQALKNCGIVLGSSMIDTDADMLKEGKALFKNLMVGLKTVLFGLKSCNPPPPLTLISAQQWGESVRGLDAADLGVVILLFQQGARGFIYYRSDVGHDKPKSGDKMPVDTTLSLVSPSSREEKDILETFATVFIHLDPAVFQEIFDTTLGAFYDCILENASLLHIPQFFLTNDGTSPNFAGLLLPFLIEKLPDLGATDHLRSSILLRLFKMCFMAVTMFPDLNEPILQPHLANIIIQAMKLSAKSASPINFYILMRALFRSIGGGRFELLYKEVLPLLQVLLECLNTLLDSARKQHEKELFVELCLTVPVRLSVLLPYLSYLMKPLVIALTAGPDLVTQGLRTLELCIDNLTQEFLDPILQPVLSELMQALWSHLKPLPHNHHHSHSALRILGKLGGRNRRFIDDSEVFDLGSPPEDQPSALITFNNSDAEQPFSWTKFVPLATNIMQDGKISVVYKEQAFPILEATVKLFVSKEELDTEFATKLRTLSSNLARESSSATYLASAETNTRNARPRLSRRLQNDEKLFKKALTGLFEASAVPSLQEQSQTLIGHITRYFAFLHLIERHNDALDRTAPFTIDQGCQDSYLSTDAFIDVLLSTLASEQSESRLLAELTIIKLHEICAIVLGSTEGLSNLPLFDTLAAKFCHACFDHTWYLKVAGTLGLSILTEKCRLDAKWFQTHQVDMVKALLYVIKDMPAEIPTDCTSNAVRLLHSIVTNSHEPSEPAKLSNSPLVSILISELANPNGTVRETVQTLLASMAKLTGVPVQQILKPVQDRLLTPIFTKPLRALPFAMQIGHIDAISFCLALAPSFLEFNDELLRLLHEAIALADAEDDHLVSVIRTSQYKSSSSLVNLRIVCIKLLTIAVASAEFGAPQQTQSRSRIIAVFFKSLYSKSADVVEVANIGLKQVLSQNHKLPKDLLQAGLRPILMNLSDHKRLTVPGLEGLARLLELLTNYFKVEIGKKLLDHLRAWADPATLQQISSKPLQEQQTIKVIAAILNIFHLLPPSAHMFLDEMVVAVLGLEEQLRRTLTSPLRSPLLKFLNRYPNETWSYLKSNMSSNSKIARFLIQLMDDPASLALRKSCIEELPSLLRSKANSDADLNITYATFVIHIVQIVSKHVTSAILSQDVITDLMILYRRIKNQSKLSGPEVDLTSDLLVQIHLSYFSIADCQLQPLLSLVEAQAEGLLGSSRSLDLYIRHSIVDTGSQATKYSLLMQSMKVFPEKNASQAYKTALFRRLINPILLMDHARTPQESSLVDTEIITQAHALIWKAALADFGENKVCGSDTLRVEVLQFSTILLRCHVDILSPLRKDVIKFAWNYIKVDDICTKNTAYVFICHFVAAYDTPAKMTAQIYFALLRTAQPEARNLVKQALDALAPVLAKRIPEGNDPRSPSWIKYSRKVIAEESNALQLIPVFQFISRQIDLFYPSREHFIPQIINALPKLGFPQGSNIESKVLAVDLLNVLLVWSESEVVTKSEDRSEKSPLALTTMQADAVFKFSLRFACMPLDGVQKGLAARIVSIITNLLRICQETAPESYLALVEPFLLEAEEKSFSAAITALEITHAILARQSSDALAKTYKQAAVWLDKFLKVNDQAVQTALQPILRAYLSSLPAVEDEIEEGSSGPTLLSKIVSQVQENLQSNSNLQSTIALLQTLAVQSVQSLDLLVPLMMKVFNNLIKEHTNPKSSGQANVGNGTISDTVTLAKESLNVDTDMTNEALSIFLDLMCQRILYLGDQRRFFLAGMAQLIEKSPNSKLCSHILSLVSNFVIQKREIFPTVKEKVSLLLKMTTFEGRGDDELVNSFLHLIIAIYKDPTIARTELTVRLEQAFLMGTRAHDFQIRTEFMNIFNSSMSRSLFTRLNYVFAVQNWESLATHFWIHQVNSLLLGSVAADQSSLLSHEICQFHPLINLAQVPDDLLIDDNLETIIDEHRAFIGSTNLPDSREIFEGLSQLQQTDVNFGEMLWIELLPCAWGSLHKKDRQEIAKAITIQLSKECHLRQVDKRPNVVQTLLKGIARCEPLISLPPHLVKYLGKTFNAWYLSLDLLERSALQLQDGDSSGLHDSTLDALTEMYASLAEEDMFYGLWRTRCKYLETNAALSYEQNGMWDKSQQMYENAQVKARTGILPFSESEYSLWEDHWIICAQKLQQWDVLTDLAKQEGYSDLLLECAWRISDWTTDREPLEASIRSLMDVPTTRRYTFEAFMALQKTQAKLESVQEFQRICDEGMQLSLRKWHQLPATICQIHIPLLQSFQQHVELQEASQIYGSLSSTHAQNLEGKSHELKHTLQTWRERLPNFYDDINGWSDLVAWRQLVFASINRVYLPLVSALQQPAGPNANSSATSFAYRGYHETAWIINRFAHVARKHQLPDVCINQLTKIYTLPNIEIQEAFLKLREQAKCHYQNPAELGMGLEVISNTNLMYFGTQQKAEFFTLKGMFLAKLKLNEEANQAFATAIQIDLTLPKAWAEWGLYSDRLFQEDSSELTKAGNAVSCYLQAAGLYKNGRARNMLSRVLWLLSLDDAEGTIASAFDLYKGEVPTWYWITFIPQLLTSLSHKEARHARQILIRIAKTFPQSLHFQLRTTKEDYAVIKKQALAAAHNASASAVGKSATTTSTIINEPESKIENEIEEKKNKDITDRSAGASQNPQAQTTDSSNTQSPQPQVMQTRQPWEHVDEIMAILKTAYPLLALSMESMVDQVQQKFKCQADEDAYRLIVALLNDGVQYIGRLVSVTADTKLPPATQANITRFAESVLPKNIKAAFEHEFVVDKPNLQDYVAKLRKWRDKFELILDRRSQTQQLEQVSPYLIEFQYQKFDEVEVPGQYLQHRDNNSDFIRIDRFMPTLDVVRGHGICYRRITMRGHDGSLHQFAIQYPAARHCRREERIIQLFRILSGVLARRKESKKRGLTFHLPAAIPLAPHIRIVQDDSSYVSLQGIYEDYCARTGQHKDDPLRLATEKIQQSSDAQNNKQSLLNLKVEILGMIQRDLVPQTIVVDFFKQSFSAFADFWRFRKHFSQQYASLTFMTYIMNINNRFPHKLFISRKSGQVWGTEILPGMAPNNPIFHNGEAVPFRFTPTIQQLIGQVSVEGVFSPAIMAIARCLTEPELELDQHLSVFVRDELITWFTQQHRPVTQETQLPDKVASNVAQIVRRASSLSQVAQGNLPAYQTIIDLISQAVNPKNLAQMDQLWSSFL